MTNPCGLFVDAQGVAFKERRWLEANRQWAPWHYNLEALVESPSGDLTVPPVGLKEGLHHLPKGHTNIENISDRSSHRMLVPVGMLGLRSFCYLLS